jgi:hypothetical protein
LTISGREFPGKFDLFEIGVSYMDITLLQNLFSVLSLIVAIFACILACIIPKRIMLNQLYTDLIAEYRSPEIGLAIISIVDFFRNNCNLQVSKIGEEYSKRYEIEFSNESKFKINETIHFKRRLLAQWYWQLENCVSKCTIPLWKVSKKQFENDFPNNETNLLKIIYYMNKEVDNNGHSVIPSAIQKIPHKGF